MVTSEEGSRNRNPSEPSPVVTTLEHYERCIDEGIDPCEDDPLLQHYMARWDGVRFFELLGDLEDKAVLEVGVGTGRLACRVLARGCAKFTGIDLSPKTILRARRNLSDFTNLELLVADIEAFTRPQAYDVAYSVLTFMHVADKARALANIVTALRPGGSVVLSIDQASPWLEFGNRRVKLYPIAPDAYTRWLTRLGCRVEPPEPLIDMWVDAEGRRSETFGRPIATLVRATKPKN
ncbi:MAG: class I SAM-dependent methyltransferase [Anaerolineae bacterium]